MTHQYILNQITIECSYRCASCTGTLDHCDKCPDSSFRDLGVSNSCLCPPKSYDQPDNPICIIIISSYTCLTCNGDKSNQCTSCYTQAGRQLNNLGECLCAQKYFENGFSQCLACNILCLECKSSADNCTNKVTQIIIPYVKLINIQMEILVHVEQNFRAYQYLQLLLNWNRIKNFQQIQNCYNKYFQIFQTQNQFNITNIINNDTYLSQTKSCQPCHYSCLTCTGRLAVECNTCWDVDNRIQQGIVLIKKYFNFQYFNKQFFEN